MVELLTSWPSQVVSHLQRSKRLGVPFPQAWRDALAEHPPRGRDMAMSSTPHLFDEQGEREESLVEATRRFCREAWDGEKPGLIRFNPELLADLDLMGLWAEDVAA